MLNIFRKFRKEDNEVVVIDTVTVIDNDGNEIVIEKITLAEEESTLGCEEEVYEENEDLYEEEIAMDNDEEEVKRAKTFKEKDAEPKEEKRNKNSKLDKIFMNVRFCKFVAHVILTTAVRTIVCIVVKGLVATMENLYNFVNKIYLSKNN